MVPVCIGRAVVRPLRAVVRPLRAVGARAMSNGVFPNDGSSGWKWEKNGIGMGGKDAGPATEIKTNVGKGKDYQVPEYFGYNQFSYFDIEKDIVTSKKRIEQPQSNMTEFW